MTFLNFKLSAADDAKIDNTESTEQVLFNTIFPTPGTIIALLVKVFPFFNKNIGVIEPFLLKSTCSKPVCETRYE